MLMLLLIGAAAFVYLGSSRGSIILNPGMVSIGSMNAITLTMKRRKLKVQRKMDHPREDAAVEGDFHLDDYRPIDPIPSSTASIRSGPIQHGIPLMPYIPKPSPPPSQTEQGEFP